MHVSDMNEESRSYLKERYFCEYAFFEAVEAHNAARSDLHGDLIRASDAVALRQRVSEIAARETRAGARPDVMELFARAANEAFEERGLEEPFPGGVAGATWREGAREFAQMTGFRPGQAEAEGSGAFLPISPYDPRFAMREFAVEAGSRLCAVRASEVGDIAGLSDRRGTVTEEIAVPVRLVTSGSDGRAARGRVVGSVASPADVSGVARLADYMSDEELAAASAWVSEAEVEASPEALAARDAMVDRARAVLAGLREMGVAYTVQPDMHPGQLRARLTDTGIDVRVFDTPDNARFIGRVYDNGSSVFFATAQGRQRGQTASFEPSPSDTLELVRLALGQPVERADGRGLVGEQSVTLSGRRQTNDAYHTSRGGFRAYTGRRLEDGREVTVLSDARRRSHRVFTYEEEAEEYLRAAIDSARESLRAEIDAEGVLEACERALVEAEAEREAADEGAEEDAAAVEPRFSWSVYESVESVQRSIAEVALGRRDTLLRPGISASEYSEAVNQAFLSNRDDYDAAAVAVDLAADGLSYRGTPEEIALAFVEDYIDHEVGTFDAKPGAVGDAFPDGTSAEGAPLRFAPEGVARHMSGRNGLFRNMDEVVAASRRLEIGARELRCEGVSSHTADKLIAFDLASAQEMSAHESPFMRRMGQVIVDALRRNGVEASEEDVLVDANGIVQWSGRAQTRQRHATTTATDALGREVAEVVGEKEVMGEIGQIFAPDEDGVVTTRFAATRNLALVPGYEASVVPQRAGESLSMEERTRLRGYEQLMASNIAYRIRQDVLDCGWSGSEDEGADRVENNVFFGEPTSLNGTYAKLPARRHEEAFREMLAECGMERHVVDAIIRTEARRVRYPSWLRDGSTVDAQWQAVHNGLTDALASDRRGDAFALTGGANISLIEPTSDGRFDPVMTATSTNQGIVRYLVADAQVAPDGSIVPGDKRSRTPLMSLPELRHSSFDSFDRQQMAASQILDASSITEPVRVAQLCVGGWTQDGGFVVSKAYAESHPIISSHPGELPVTRPLSVGDKQSDLHGNKGVISLVVDPDMDDEEARRQGIGELVRLFRANPSLSVVGEPFPYLSRSNGGTARELMESPADLVLPDGTTVAGGTGEMRMIITDKAADAKTSAYDDDAVRSGRGRKASAQLAWVLNARGAHAIMQEFYAPNGSALAEVKEMMLACGLDLSDTGEMSVGIDASAKERKVFAERPLALTDKGNVAMARMLDGFSDEVGRSGGMLELPFPLTLKSGAVTPQTEGGKWLAPIMSSYLRSGREMEDGQVVTHDYTRSYIDLYKATVTWRDAERRIGELAGGDASPEEAEAAEQRLRARQDAAISSAQAALDHVANAVSEMRFEGKHNVFRDRVMARRLPHSATAVVSPDPRLAIDEVGVSRSVAGAMGLTDGESVMIWRDPILRTGAVRYVRAKVVDGQAGMSIHPAMVGSSDGDFDGDTYAIVRLTTEAAKEEAKRLFSVDENLLDLASGARADHPLYLNCGLEAKVGAHESEAVASELEGARVAANQVMQARLAGQVGGSEVVGEVSEAFRHAYAESFGKAAIRFDAVESHIDSVRAACIETGAKGSPKHMAAYLRQLGVEGEVDPVSGAVTGARDTGSTLATRDDIIAVQKATAIKSFGTGLAGAFSQRGVAALRNASVSRAPAGVAPEVAAHEPLESVLETTYLVTQGVLQIKKDPVAAERYYDILKTTLRNHWEGRLLERDERGGWQTVFGSDGEAVQASPAAWVEQMMDVYGSADGFGVSISRDECAYAASALSQGAPVMPGALERAEMASPLDRLAYSASFDLLQELAKDGRSLFEGRLSRDFAPAAVRHNLAADAADAAARAAGLEAAPAGRRAAPTKSDVAAGTSGRARHIEDMAIDRQRVAVRSEPSGPEL